MSNSQPLVRQPQNYCNILREDDLSYGVTELFGLNVVQELASVVSANIQRATPPPVHFEEGLHRVFTGQMISKRPF